MYHGLWSQKKSILICHLKATQLSQFKVQNYGCTLLVKPIKLGLSKST